MQFLSYSCAREFVASLSADDLRLYFNACGSLIGELVFYDACGDTLVERSVQMFYFDGATSKVRFSRIARSRDALRSFASLARLRAYFV